VLALLKKYGDREMDLADACIVRMTELMRDCHVVTLDRSDFNVYRRNGRELISLIAPPKNV
jgi:predicted nucleic acid-binding protein